MDNKLQTEEEANTDLKDKSRVSGASAADDEEEKKRRINSATGPGESAKKEAACTIYRSNDAKKTQENLITFSRQKLALLQCDYDPKRCGFCEMFSSELMQCTKCKTAKYCSKKCAAKDWEKRHKDPCKEIRRLQQNIDQKINSDTSKIQRFAMKLSGQPYFLKRTMEYSKLHFFEGKLLMCGFQCNAEYGTFIDLYNANTFQKESTVVNIEENFNIGGFCVLTIENALYVTVSIHSIPIYLIPVELNCGPLRLQHTTLSTLSRIGEQFMAKCASPRANC